MMSENLVAFLQFVKTNEDARDALSDALSQGAAAVAEVAKKAGFQIEASDLESLMQTDSGALTDAELDAVAGGSTVVGGLMDRFDKFFNPR